jgi:hypothetical protein
MAIEIRSNKNNAWAPFAALRMTRSKSTQVLKENDDESPYFYECTFGAAFDWSKRLRTNLNTTLSTNLQLEHRYEPRAD